MGEVNEVPTPGQVAPDFQVLDSTGLAQQLSSLAARRSLVLIFYRGYWWAFCLRQLAEFRAHSEEFRALRVDLAAISVDGPEHSEPLRQLYQIPFPILCDTQAEVTKSWGLYDPLEKGGIARSAVFVIEPGLRVRYCSVDSTTTRIRAAELLAYLQALAAGAEAAAPERRVIVPTPGELIRTTLPSLKLTLFPKKR